MYYSLETRSDIIVHAGDTIEVLEAFYRKYADEILISKIGHKGKVYDLTLPFESNVDLMKLKTHEAYVEEVKRTKKSIKINAFLPDSVTNYTDIFIIPTGSRLS